VQLALYVGTVLIKGRVQCRTDLFAKHVVDSPVFFCGPCRAPEETTGHIFFNCPAPWAIQLWEKAIEATFPATRNLFVPTGGTFYSTHSEL
jgi:hypothetical protein